MTESVSHSHETDSSELASVDVAPDDVLEVVRDLVRELRGDAVSARATVDSRLEHDLGISSLERAELVVRLEQRFGHSQGDPALAVAESARALAEALSRAGVRVPARLKPTLDLPADIRPAPLDLRTLPEVLAWHATAHPERVHVVLRHDDRDEIVTFGELYREAQQIGAGLRALGVESRDPVAIMLRTERAFFQAFFGVLAVGAVPVPMYPPFRPDRIADYAERQVGILESCGARVMITFDQVERVASLLEARLSQPVAVVTVDDIRAKAGAEPSRMPAESGAAALIQYTSGSTGDPKGVYLTHDNLLANIRAIGERLALRDGDRLVSWLPLYHDMGLIGSWLGSLYFGVPALVMSPLMFLSRPARWLQALSEFRGTVSPGPNFAYDLCVRRVEDGELDGVDLSCVRLLLNGSEAVLPATLRRFADRFSSYGLSATTMCPVYGLAECAVGLTAPPPGREPWVDVVSRDVLQIDGVARPTADEPSVSFVSCGPPLPGHELRIVDERGAVVAERVQGQVEFRGPSVSAGYFRRPDATASIKTKDGWTRTGDLGYLAQGEFFITGRGKDIIIRAGRNLYPQELEELSSAVTGVRAGCVAAFGVASGVSGTERVVIVAETREDDPVARERLTQAIASRVAGAVGVPPDEVYLVRPGSVLKTSSGKVRRAATREALLGGRLKGRSPTATGQWMQLAIQALEGRARRLARSCLAWGHTLYLSVLVLVSLPVLYLTLLAATPPVSRRCLRAWCRALVRFSWCRLVVEGLRTGQAASPVYAANHGSYLDPIWLLAALPFDVRFAAKARLANYPILGLVLRRCGFILIEKSDHHERVASAGALERAIDGGVPLAVFPEGTFVRSPGLLPFRLGAFRAAVQRAAAVTPIGIRGARDVLPDGAWCVRPGRITVIICPPVAARDGSWQEAIRVRDTVRAEIARVTGELAPEGDPETELFSAL